MFVTKVTKSIESLYVTKGRKNIRIAYRILGSTIWCAVSANAEMKGITGCETLINLYASY